MGQYLYDPDFHDALYLNFIGTYFRPSKTAAFKTIACVTVKERDSSLMVNLIVNLSGLRSMGNYAQTPDHVYEGLSKLD